MGGQQAEDKAERKKKEKKKTKKKNEDDLEADKLAAMDADLDDMLANILTDDGSRGRGEDSLAKANAIMDEVLMDRDELEMINEINRKRENGGDWP